MSKKYYIVIGLGLLALFADQLTKLFFQNDQGFQFIVWEPLLFFGFQSNTNIAFGLPIGSALFIIFLLAVLGILIYLLVKTVERKEFFQFCLIISILAGALGNIIDRIRFGYVIDFIHVPFWSIFNLADIYLVVAVVIWMVYLIFYESRKKIPKKS